MPHTYPEAFARFYDLMYHNIRDGVDIAFFLEKIRKCRGKVLEVGAGTGRLFIEALSTGADIYGFDISESMIRVLGTKLGEDQRKRISIQNIVDFSYDFQFDLIIAPFRVFMHLIGREDQLKALNNVYSHLNAGGEFIFDTFVPDPKQLSEGLDNFTDFEAEYEPAKKFRRTVSTRPELINQLIHITFLLEWEEADGLKKEKWETALRFFFRFELEYLIESSMFEEFQILGDYKGNELNEHSKEFVAICNKQEHVF